MSAAIVESIKMFPEQLMSGWRSVRADHFNFDTQSILNIVWSGMGGSGLSAHLVQSVSENFLHLPLIVSNSPKLPFFVGQQSLVFICSYSGNTAESISALEHAMVKQAKVVVVSSDGLLSDYAKKYGLPYVQIDTTLNPSGLPRMGVGFGVGVLSKALSLASYMDYKEEEFAEDVKRSGNYIDEFLNYESREGKVKELVDFAYNKQLMLISSGHLVGATHVFQNVMNETAKQMATYHTVPELNHHMMEGLSHPNLEEGSSAIVFESDLYEESVKPRMPLTKEVFEKQKIKTKTYKLHAPTLMSQALELVVLSQVVGMSLSELNHEDSSKTPWVDYFKQKLG